MTEVATANERLSLTDSLKDSNYSLGIFSESEIISLESKVTLRNNKPYLECIVRNKDI